MLKFEIEKMERVSSNGSAILEMTTSTQFHVTDNDNNESDGMKTILKRTKRKHKHIAEDTSILLLPRDNYAGIIYKTSSAKCMVCCRNNLLRVVCVTT